MPRDWSGCDGVKPKGGAEESRTLMQLALSHAEAICGRVPYPKMKVGADATTHDNEQQTPSTCWLDGPGPAPHALAASEADDGQSVSTANLACATKLSKSSSLDAYAILRSACDPADGLSSSR